MNLGNLIQKFWVFEGRGRVRLPIHEFSLFFFVFTVTVCFLAYNFQVLFLYNLFMFINILLEF